jgi:hypothetical protein
MIWLVLAALAVALLWMRQSVHNRSKAPGKPAIADLGVSSPLNQPGGDAAPAEAYEVYSALYETPAGEPLAFAADSMTDIPQVNGSCLRPQTTQEREMTDAFEAANRQSHRWENRFSIAAGYRILSHDEALHAQYCIVDGGQGRIKRCEDYRQLRHVRYLGIPGFDHTKTRALVSVVKECGGDCGSGGIFEVERVNGHWQRADASDFTRECNWMY